MVSLKNIEIVIITGNEKRHRYYANEMAKHFTVKMTIFEKKANIHNNIDYLPSDKSVISKHFEQRSLSEDLYFGNINYRQDYDFVEIEHGEINSQSWVGKIIELDPRFILLFGSSIIKNPLLKHFEDRVINLHLGLSPYYKGSGTNFWPLVHHKPECLGSTIHLATLNVDAGAILHQLRPENLSLIDSIHDLGNKTIIDSINQIPKIIQAFSFNKINPVEQNLKEGFICKRKDLTASSICAVIKNFENGLVENYLNNKLERDSKYPIVTFNT